MLQESIVRALFGESTERFLELSRFIESISATVTSETLDSSGFPEALRELGEIALLHGYQMTMTVIGEGLNPKIQFSVRKVWDTSQPQ